MMRKNFGAQSWLFPMPVLIVAAYGEDGTPNVMNAAWGGIYDENKVMICLAQDHKTTKNIKLTGAFTVSFATGSTVVPCDYVGIVSGNREPKKLEKAGFHTTKSQFVDAPVIDELPVALECELEKIIDDEICVGRIINVCAEERVLDEKGKIDLKKLDPIIFDCVKYGYWNLGEKVGQGFSDGTKLK